MGADDHDGLIRQGCSASVQAAMDGGTGIPEHEDNTYDTPDLSHTSDDTIRGHVFCSFLSLLLIKELQDRLSDKGVGIEWNDLVNDLEDFREIRIQTSDKDVLLRSELKGDTGKVFQAVGIAIPPKVRMLDKEGAIVNA